MKVKKVSTSEARAHFGDVVNSVYYSKQAVALEKKGKVLAVLVSPELFERVQEEDARDWEVIQALKDRNASIDPDEIYELVTAEVEAVRREKHDSKRAS